MVEEIRSGFAMSLPAVCKVGRLFGVQVVSGIDWSEWAPVVSPRCQSSGRPIRTDPGVSEGLIPGTRGSTVRVRWRADKLSFA